MASSRGKGAQPTFKLHEMRSAVPQFESNSQFGDQYQDRRYIPSYQVQSVKETGRTMPHANYDLSKLYEPATQELRNQQIPDSDIHINSSPSDTSNTNTALTTENNGRISHSGNGKMPSTSMIPHPYDMTTRNFPRRDSRTQSASSTRALELLRSTVQYSFNKEIMKLCEENLMLYEIAAKNIRENTGDNITRDDIYALIRKSLDESKRMFEPGKTKASQSGEKRERIKEPRIEKYKHKAATVKQNIHATVAAKKKGIKLKRKVRGKGAKGERGSKMARLEDKHPALQWHEDDVDYNTRFILGSKANKILGYSSARGRLYSKHPQLFKYVGDQDDRQWLYDNKLLPITGGKAYMLIARRVKQLVEDFEEYRNNDTIQGRKEELNGFHVPRQMIEKMKNAIRASRKAAESSTRRYNKVHRKRDTKQSIGSDEKEKRNYGSHTSAKSDQVENGKSKETDKSSDTTKGHSLNEKELRRPASASSSRRSSREKPPVIYSQDSNSSPTVGANNSDEETDDAEETLETNRKLQYEESQMLKQAGE
ncbi:Deoxynucleotidyltransferase terminal-interacting protein 1 [Trichoplax sp. H2]|nr:Deoxynucleotidyltransferase terminal-interacting protein 1 [Trichoplax sp. H2]|eukprot:RDD46517.1 Deoxynucleotidyltransferase terminal-interacting protein 1 [Trichoplax sp. H2]